MVALSLHVRSIRVRTCPTLLVSLAGAASHVRAIPVKVLLQLRLCVIQQSTQLSGLLLECAVLFLFSFNAQANCVRLEQPESELTKCRFVDAIMPISRQDLEVRPTLQSRREIHQLSRRDLVGRERCSQICLGRRTDICQGQPCGADHRAGNSLRSRWSRPFSRRCPICRRKRKKDLTCTRCVVQWTRVSCGPICKPPYCQRESRDPIYSWIARVLIVGRGLVHPCQHGVRLHRVQLRCFAALRDEHRFRGGGEGRITCREPPRGAGRGERRTRRGIDIWRATYRIVCC